MNSREALNTRVFHEFGQRLQRPGVSEMSVFILFHQNYAEGLGIDQEYAIAMFKKSLETRAATGESVEGIVADATRRAYDVLEENGLIDFGERLEPLQEFEQYEAGLPEDVRLLYGLGTN